MTMIVMTVEKIAKLVAVFVELQILVVILVVVIPELLVMFLVG